MWVNYYNGDLHLTERETGLSNKKTGNVPKTVLSCDPSLYSA